MDNERFFWIRIIKKYQGRLKDFPKFWKLVIDKTPIETVKQIAIAVSQFVQRPHLYSFYKGSRDYIYLNEVSNIDDNGDPVDQVYAMCRTWSLVAISANHGDLALLQYIVNKIKLKNVRKTERINALNLAAFKGHLEIYKFLSRKLRDKNPGNKSQVNVWGRTPLHWAADQGHFGVCKFIIENTSNKNPASIMSGRNTPLHWAAENGHLEVCKLIMDNVTDKNPANRYTLTAPKGENWVEKVEEETPFHLAAKKGQLAVCQFMLQNLSDKNPAAQTSRVTPLHYAAEYGHVEVCKLIMENVVDKNPSDSLHYPSTPLSRAVTHEKSEVCQLFHENGFIVRREWVKPENLL